MAGLKKILLVDDEKSVADVTAAMLTRLGYRVSVRTSSHDGLEAFRSLAEQIDLVLADLNMPQMNGLEMLDELRAGEETRDIPVVVLTTSSEERDQQASYAHGANGYVVKALNLEQFGEALAQIKRRWLPRLRLG